MRIPYYEHLLLRRPTLYLIIYTTIVCFYLSPKALRLYQKAHTESILLAKIYPVTITIFPNLNNSQLTTKNNAHLHYHPEEYKLTNTLPNDYIDDISDERHYEDLVNQFPPRMTFPALFGNDFLQHSKHNIQMNGYEQSKVFLTHLKDDPFLCGYDSISNESEEEKIVLNVPEGIPVAILASRGKCSFQTKALNLQSKYKASNPSSPIQYLLIYDNILSLRSHTTAEPPFSIHNITRSMPIKFADSFMYRFLPLVAENYYGQKHIHLSVSYLPFEDGMDFIYNFIYRNSDEEPPEFKIPEKRYTTDLKVQVFNETSISQIEIDAMMKMMKRLTNVYDEKENPTVITPTSQQTRILPGVVIQFNPIPHDKYKLMINEKYINVIIPPQDFDTSKKNKTDDDDSNHSLSDDDYYNGQSPESIREQLTLALGIFFLVLGCCSCFLFCCRLDVIIDGRGIRLRHVNPDWNDNFHARLRRSRGLLTRDQVLSLPEVEFQVPERIGNDDDYDDHNLKCSSSSSCHKALLVEPLLNHRSWMRDIITCSICLEDYEQGEKLRMLPCQHTFHTNCILPWLTERFSNCPLCKEVVVIDDIQSISGSSSSSSISRQSRDPIERILNYIGYNDVVPADISDTREEDDEISGDSNNMETPLLGDST